MTLVKNTLRSEFQILAKSLEGKFKLIERDLNDLSAIISDYHADIDAASSYINLIDQELREVKDMLDLKFLDRPQLPKKIVS